MALVNHKTIVLDVDDEVHKAFYPFKNKKEVLAREGASVCVPLEDCFVPYFARLNT